jgi:hypothetical protein
VMESTGHATAEYVLSRATRVRSRVSRSRPGSEVNEVRTTSQHHDSGRCGAGG